MISNAGAFWPSRLSSPRLTGFHSYHRLLQSSRRAQAPQADPSTRFRNPSAASLSLAIILPVCVNKHCFSGNFHNHHHQQPSTVFWWQVAPGQLSDKGRHPNQRRMFVCLPTIHFLEATLQNGKRVTDASLACKLTQPPTGHWVRERKQIMYCQLTHNDKRAMTLA